LSPGEEISLLTLINVGLEQSERLRADLILGVTTLMWAWLMQSPLATGFGIACKSRSSRFNKQNRKPQEWSTYPSRSPVVWTGGLFCK
jgi:hypothetical protein